jgi:hypothetical protein
MCFVEYEAQRMIPSAPRWRASCLRKDLRECRPPRFLSAQHRCRLLCLSVKRVLPSPVVDARRPLDFELVVVCIAGTLAMMRDIGKLELQPAAGRNGLAIAVLV